ncbi:MAG TPA: DUF488 domain-containing protein [Acidimicrobiia bacterium]|nr:DUF488 domain-containing protein [Acidimicrobiia bacterium]
MQIYTIGFTHKSAESFFAALRQQGIERLVDVRIVNTSQLAGFTKMDDLRFFLDELLDADYVHQPALAPTKELMRSYRHKEKTWPEFERAFLDLMAERRVEDLIPRDLFDRRSVLLCSEVSAERCHRRLVVEYLDGRWGDLEPIHL